MRRDNLCNSASQVDYHPDLLCCRKRIAIAVQRVLCGVYSGGVITAGIILSEVAARQRNLTPLQDGEGRNTGDEANPTWGENYCFGGALFFTPHMRRVPSSLAVAR